MVKWIQDIKDVYKEFFLASNQILVHFPKANAGLRHVFHILLEIVGLFSSRNLKPVEVGVAIHVVVRGMDIFHLRTSADRGFECPKSINPGVSLNSDNLLLKGHARK